MLKHCVFIKFRPQVAQAERHALYDAILEVQARVSGWLGFVAGANVTLEAGMDKGFNGGFIIDFADAVALQTYQLDEKHQQVGARLVAAAEGGLQGILVFDMAC